MAKLETPKVEPVKTKIPVVELPKIINSRNRRGQSHMSVIEKPKIIKTELTNNSVDQSEDGRTERLEPKNLISITIESPITHPLSQKSDSPERRFEQKETVRTEPDFLPVPSDQKGTTFQSQKNLKSSPSNDSLQIKGNDNFRRFDLAKDEFKFGTIGIYNTERGKFLYKVVAKVGAHTVAFSKVDWNVLTPTTWRFLPNPDTLMTTRMI